MITRNKCPPIVIVHGTHGVVDPSTILQKVINHHVGNQSQISLKYFVDFVRKMIFISVDYKQNS